MKSNGREPSDGLSPVRLEIGRCIRQVPGMGKIRVLSDRVASQVAAGEVVERPASVVKELIENALDAGAARICIEYARGGSRLVSVRDDGCGMDREDALLCLERHATSKIRSGDDLEGVRTMGFRGEALPSIASVARLRIVTREPSAPAGTELRVAGGRLEEVKEIGAAPGTLVEVRDLFFSVPARRKFLRGEETESAHIYQVLLGIALAHPGVALESRKDGRPILTLPRADELSVRIRDALGAEHLGRLLAIETIEGDGFRVSGFIARPGHGRRDRLHQFVILNGRCIHCPAVQQSLREAYAGVLGQGEHPVCVLSIAMRPELADCNVHPAKREVRLRRPEDLRRAISDAARAALAQARPQLPVARAPQDAVPRFIAAPVQQAADFARPEAPEEPAGPDNGKFRYLGAVNASYLVLEGDEGLVLLDARAAAERILFESLLRRIESGEAPSQRLLIPLAVELPPREHAWIADHLEELRSAGFAIEAFGAGTLKVEAVPAGAGEADPGRLLHEISSSLRAAGRLPRGRGLREALARSVAAMAAGGRVGEGASGALRLIGELLRCELPYASPTGRPTMIQFSFAELDRRFGRCK